MARQTRGHPGREGGCGRRHACHALSTQRRGAARARRITNAPVYSSRKSWAYVKVAAVMSTSSPISTYLSARAKQ
eukprot:1760213-Pleurochrysis_carterae.AAC.2